MFWMMMHNDRPLFVCETGRTKTLVIPIGFVLRNPSNPKESELLVKTDGAGMYPFKELRSITQNDLKDFPGYSEFFKDCEIKQCGKLDLQISF